MLKLCGRQHQRPDMSRKLVMRIYGEKFMFTLMYVAQRQSHLTPVSISKLPHMLSRRISITERGLCVGKPSMGISFWPALRMRNLIFRSFSVSAMIFMPLHICRLKKKNGKKLSSFCFLFGSPFWLHLNQLVAVLCLHISTSFGSSNVQFYDACGDSGCPMKICKHFESFPLFPTYPQCIALLLCECKSLFISNYHFIVLLGCLRTL